MPDVGPSPTSDAAAGADAAPSASDAAGREPAAGDPAPVTVALRVVRGAATAEELAALLAVLAARLATVAADDARADGGARHTEWSSPGRRVRAPLAPGATAWRASALPR